MQDYKRGSRSVWDCEYHIVWTTKYRYEILAGDVGNRGRELLREISRSKEMVIYAESINRDHVHILIGIPPNLSVLRAVQYLKGKSSHKLLSEYNHLRKRYWGQHLWGRGYWVASSGNVTDEVWKECIKNQKAPALAGGRSLQKKHLYMAHNTFSDLTKSTNQSCTRRFMPLIFVLGSAKKSAPASLGPPQVLHVSDWRRQR